MCSIWVVEKVIVLLFIEYLFFQIILGGDQSKWQIGEVNSVTFSGQLENNL